MNFEHVQNFEFIIVLAELVERKLTLSMFVSFVKLFCLLLLLLCIIDVLDDF